MEQQQKQLLVFGYGLPAILAVLGLRHWYRYGLDATAGMLLSVAVAVLLITVLNKPLLKVLWTYWMKAMHLIGGTITAVILTALFFTVFAVAGIILRLLRKDLLGLRMSPQARSYWIIRSKSKRGVAGYTEQF